MSVDNTVQPVEAEDIFGQVRRQLRRERLLPVRSSAVRLYSGAVRSWRAGGPEANPLRASGDTEEIAERLQALYTSLDLGFAASVARIGEMPPAMATVRGLLARAVIGALQRLLWWYTRSLQHFGESVGAHLHYTTELLETLACIEDANRAEVAALREEVRLLKERATDEPGAGR